jgi:hypothetical protein
MKIEIKTTKLVGFGLEYFTITSPAQKSNSTKRTQLLRLIKE